MEMDIFVFFDFLFYQLFKSNYCLWNQAYFTLWHGNDTKMYLKDKFTQEWTLSHHLLTSMPLESRVKFCSPETCLELQDKIMLQHSLTQLKSGAFKQDKNKKRKWKAPYSSSSDVIYTIDVQSGLAPTA